MKTPVHLNRRTFVATSLHSTAALVLSSWSSASPSSSLFKLPVSQARALVVGDHDVLAIAADRQVLFYTLAGERLRVVETGRPARALCHDAQGRLWMTFGDQVARLTDDGTVETFGASLGRESALTGIAVAHDGRVFVADSARRVIWRLDARGQVQGQIRAGEKGFAVSRAFFPIAWQGEYLIVAEPGRHQIQRYTAEGSLVSHWGMRSRDESGFAGCCNPVSFAALADGSVLTVERGQVRVKRFDAAGVLTGQLAGPEAFTQQRIAREEGDLFGCEGGLLDVAATHDGRGVVLDRTACEVHVIG